MASAMRKMAVYLGLVEDGDRRFQDKYDAYEDYDDYDDDEPDAVEAVPDGPDYSGYQAVEPPGRASSAADGPAADHDAPPAHLQ